MENVMIFQIHRLLIHRRVIRSSWRLQWLKCGNRSLVIWIQLCCVVSKKRGTWWIGYLLKECECICLFFILNFYWYWFCFFFGTFFFNFFFIQYLFCSSLVVAIIILIFFLSFLSFFSMFFCCTLSNYIKQVLD